MSTDPVLTANLYARCSPGVKESKKRGTACRAPTNRGQTIYHRRLVMCFLSFERQVVIMMRLGHRADALDDRLPVIAFVVAVENIAVRGAGENCVAAVPRVHRHAFNVGANMLRQSAR